MAENKRATSGNETKTDIDRKGQNVRFSATTYMRYGPLEKNKGDRMYFMNSDITKTIHLSAILRA
jgi:hypothetical protein